MRTQRGRGCASWSNESEGEGGNSEGIGATTTSRFLVKDIKDTLSFSVVSSQCSDRSPVFDSQTLGGLHGVRQCAGTFSIAQCGGGCDNGVAVVCEGEGKHIETQCIIDTIHGLFHFGCKAGGRQR